MILKCQLVSDAGCLRTTNEDMILFNGKFYRNESFEQIFEVTSQMRFAAIVADGIGGNKGGELASELAVNAFNDFMTMLPAGLPYEALYYEVRKWVDKTHSFIQSKGLEMPQYKDMGTTIVGIFSYNDHLYRINIGDSRLYRFRNGVLKQLTCDHSMRELTGDPNSPSNMIYNSLGAGISAFADFTDMTGQLLADDMLLICSDGLSDMLTDEQIIQTMSENPTALHLTETAKSAGGKDNISVILLKATERKAPVFFSYPAHFKKDNVFLHTYCT